MHTHHAVSAADGSVADAVAQATGAGGHGARRLAADAVEALHERATRWRGAAARASDRTVDYIQVEPVKAVLIAAAAGAALMALASLLGRLRS